MNQMQAIIEQITEAAEQARQRARAAYAEGHDEKAEATLSYAAGLQHALNVINARIMLKPLNIRRDTAWGEYVVPAADGNPDHAYRTSDKQDAIDTAHHYYYRIPADYTMEDVKRALAYCGAIA